MGCAYIRIDRFSIYLTNISVSLCVTPWKYGGTALHVAAAHGHVKVVEVLLDRGANIEARNDVSRH